MFNSFTQLSFVWGFVVGNNCNSLNETEDTNDDTYVREGED